MKRDKGKKGGGREKQKKSGFPPLPHSDQTLKLIKKLLSE